MTVFEKTVKYTDRVKVSDWQHRMESLPYDNPSTIKKGASHYRSFGINNEVIVPKSTMQEFFLAGTDLKRVEREVAMHEINFVSYPMNDYRFDRFTKYKLDLKAEPPKSTYQDNYKLHKPLVAKCSLEQTPDPLMNRIPQCDFDLQPWSEFKFMDDNIKMVGENRKKINFLRQIRNATSLFK